MVPMQPLASRLARSLLKTPPDRRDSGLTLIEGLVAILIVSAVTVSLTPAIFLSVATRIQNRRAEQAVQLANGQIDQVRVLVEQGIADEDDIEQLPSSASGNALDVPPPSSEFGSLQSTNYECSDYDRDGAPPVPVDSALPVDVNGDCEVDFFVQSFRTGDVTAERDEVDVPIVFRMGVRVYYRNAQFGSLQADEASLVLTNGSGQQTQYPLAVLYTDMAQSDTSISRKYYQCFLEGDSECDEP